MAQLLAADVREKFFVLLVVHVFLRFYWFEASYSFTPFSQSCSRANLQLTARVDPKQLPWDAAVELNFIDMSAAKRNRRYEKAFCNKILGSKVHMINKNQAKST